MNAASKNSVPTTQWRLQKHAPEARKMTVATMSVLHTGCAQHAPGWHWMRKGNATYGCENARLKAGASRLTISLISSVAPVRDRQGGMSHRGSSGKSTETPLPLATWSDVVPPAWADAAEQNGPVFKSGLCCALASRYCHRASTKGDNGDLERTFGLCPTARLWEPQGCRGTRSDEGDGRLSLEARPRGRMRTHGHEVPMNLRSGRGKGGVLLR